MEEKTILHFAHVKLFGDVNLKIHMLSVFVIFCVIKHRLLAFYEGDLR